MRQISGLTLPIINPVKNTVAERFIASRRNPDDISNPERYDSLYWKKKKQWEKDKALEDKTKERPGLDRPLTYREYIKIRQKTDDNFRR